MNSVKKNIYVLGTGLSHDGSACLLKNGKICVAIEKERITRIKHDGFNDSHAITYCLEAEGITLKDVDLVVQNSNAGFFKYGNSYFGGKRLLTDDLDVPVVTISHHLAHAYYAVGTCSYDEAAILVLDGCGSPYDDCIDLIGGKVVPENIPDDIKHLYSEKDSLYLYRDNQLKPIFKDFSPDGLRAKNYPMHPLSTKHSIGGAYSAAAAYCFQKDVDTGKLMGLAPYGRPGVYQKEIFEFQDERIFLKYDWMDEFNKPARSYKEFWDNFQYYADIALWIQRETERAILSLLRSRRALVDTENLAYTGGVALNAVVNGKILSEGLFKNHYFTPAAGDNGLAIGCAYYGWLEVLKREKIFHNGSSNFGKVYPNSVIKDELQGFRMQGDSSQHAFVRSFFKNIGDYTNLNAVFKDDYFVQFIISDLGVFNLVFHGDKAALVEDNLRSPDATINTDSATFMGGFIDRSNFLNSVNEGKTVLRGEYKYFLSVVKIEELTKAVLLSIDSGGNKILFVEESDVIRKTADLLANGKVIAWFQGGSEFGPRALGYRSILADPRKEGIQKFINNKVKFREDFRPFAPAVLREEVGNYFEFSGDSPYMIMVAQVKENCSSKIPGVVHVDNSARIQTVTREANDKFYDLLKSFQEITGLPILINTSFNKKGMPIVETPNQALAFFYECELDCLVIDNFIVYKDKKLFASPEPGSSSSSEDALLDLLDLKSSK